MDDKDQVDQHKGNAKASLHNQLEEFIIVEPRLGVDQHKAFNKSVVTIQFFQEHVELY